jgi:hypothetical protein
MRCVLGIIAVLLGLLLIEFAVVQIAHPVTSIIQTRGLVVKTLREKTESESFPDVCYQVQFVTNTGQVVETEFLDGEGEISVNDVVPVVYFPWQPLDAQVGQMDRMFILGPSIQQIAALIAGFLGLLLIVGSTRFLRACFGMVSKKSSRFIVRLTILFAILGAAFAIFVWAWMLYLPSLATDFGC